jgi:HlyD family secretion protein
MSELVPGSGPHLPTVPSSPANPVVVEAKAADPSREVRQGLFIAFLFFVVFLGWAALIPLDAGAFGHGEVEVSGSRQAVQYREGGVVSALHVHEGDFVRQNQVLVEISADELRATERSLTAEVLALEAQKARLEAERDGRPDLIPPADFATLSPKDQLIAQDALRLQRQQMVARREALSSKRGVLHQRTAQLNQQIEGLNRQMSANREQQDLISDELKGVKDLEAKGYAPKTRVRALERAAADLRGTSGSQAAQAAQAREAIGQTQMEVIGLERGQTEEVMDTLRQTELQLGDLRPKLMAAREQLARALVRAPATGRVVGLSVFTVGGVVQPGQTLMEIVPSHAELIIKARFSPNDADDLMPDQKTEIRIPAFHQRNMPIINGRIAEISADAFVDEKTGQRYFTGEIEVPPSEVAKIAKVRGGEAGLKPGLPVEVVVPLRKRTALQYFFEPLQQTFWQSFREH